MGVDMKALKLILILTFTALFASQTVLADQEVTTEKSLGEKLLVQLWSDMAKPDMEAIEKTISKGFQSVHQSGSSNYEQEIELIKGLKLGEYTLTDINITQDGPVIVATYFVSVAETIDGKRLSKTPAPRMSVFLQTESGWKWIAHANLKPLK